MKKNLGITLIALVITIIVLLILAGVTLSLTLGENGLLKRAEESKTAHLRGEQNDIEFMNGAYEYMNPYFGEGGNNTEENTVTPGGDEPTPPTPPEEISKLTEEEKTKLENNGIKELGKDEITNDNLKDNENIKGVITGEVPIPTGAEYKEGTKETGVVVTFGSNEFVWVPVPEINKMARLQSGSTVNYQGVLYNYSGTTATEKTGYGIGTTSYREPDITTQQYYGDISSRAKAKYGVMNNLIGTSISTEGQLKTMLQQDFNSMVASVTKYAGFYIGRYETSIDKANKRAFSRVGVSPANATASSADSWYGLYGFEKNMAVSNGIESCFSQMVWGCNYDAMLCWALKGKDSSKVTATGNASHNLGAPYATGRASDRLNNIYDLEGNCYEWTAEALGTSARVFRGGVYKNNYSSSAENARPIFRQPKDSQGYPAGANSGITEPIQSSRIVLLLK